MSQKKSFTSSFSAPGKEKGTLCYAIQARLSAVESACRDKGPKIFSLTGKTFENISNNNIYLFIYLFIKFQRFLHWVKPS
jgi:hypothetical protein